MTFRVEISPDANAQLDALNAWWRDNRPAAKNRVLEEMRRLETLLTSSAQIVTIYRRRGFKHVRWLRLRTTPYRLFYRYEPGTDLIAIVAIWSSAHKAGPPLPR